MRERGEERLFGERVITEGVTAFHVTGENADDEPRKKDAPLAAREVNFYVALEGNCPWGKSRLNRCRVHTTFRPQIKQAKSRPPDSTFYFDT